MFLGGCSIIADSGCQSRDRSRSAIPSLFTRIHKLQELQELQEGKIAGGAGEAGGESKSAKAQLATTNDQ
ncbi:MAG: hypothetical protein D6728_05025 [Cyanobacteria bacterium J055]|nr:MAG: hypothetical protein D6728_05025 [Cyanobacteria bacterium J055]